MTRLPSQPFGSGVLPGLPGQRWPPPVASPCRMCFVRPGLAKLTRPAVRGTDTFHSASFDQIATFVDHVIPTVGSRTATGNTIPMVDAGPDHTIPAVHTLYSLIDPT